MNKNKTVTSVTQAEKQQRRQQQCEINPAVQPVFGETILWVALSPCV